MKRKFDQYIHPKTNEKHGNKYDYVNFNNHDIKFYIYNFLDFPALLSLRGSNRKDREMLGSYLTPERLIKIIFDNESSFFRDMYVDYCQVSGLNNKFMPLTSVEAAILYLMGVPYSTGNINKPTMSQLAMVLDGAPALPPRLATEYQWQKTKLTDMLEGIKFDIQTPSFEEAKKYNFINPNFQTINREFIHLKYRPIYLKKKLIELKLPGNDSSNIKPIEENFLDVRFEAYQSRNYTVYSGYHQQDTVAIKVPWDDNAKIALQQEINILSKIQSSEQNSSVYFTKMIGLSGDHGVFQLYPYGSLEMFLHHNGHRVNLKLRLEMLAHIAKGIGVLHQSGIFHRDLNLGNILIDKDGCPKIGDFEHATLRYEKDNFITGALLFCSPKLLQHQKSEEICDFNDKDEMYSFTMLMYLTLKISPICYVSFHLYMDNKMDSRNHPWEKKNHKVSYTHVASQNKRGSIPYYLPKSIAALIQRGWDKNEAQRPSFQEANEILSEASNKMSI